MSTCVRSCTLIALLFAANVSSLWDAGVFASTATFNLQYPHVPGQLIVKFRDAANGKTKAKAKILKAMDGRAMFDFRASGATLIEFKVKGTGKDLLQRAEALAKLPQVEYVEANTILSLNSRIPNDRDFGMQYALLNSGANNGVAGADIKATQAWDITTGSRRVLVGVIDTGIDYNHPDIKPNYWTNPGESGPDASGKDKATNEIDDDGNGYVDDFRGWNFVDNNNNPLDDHNHGTHCAGVIGGAANDGVGIAGVNWQVSLVALKFLSASGSGSLADAIKAVEYGTTLGVQLTSNSWGGGGYSDAMEAAIRAARDHGILFIAAAGNDAVSNDADPHYPSSYAIDNVISVAATDNQDQLAEFSNFGRDSVHVGAPGVNIHSAIAGGDYKTMSGTSMATPHVAGLAALIAAAYPKASYDGIRQRILASVDPVPALDGKTITGGRINALTALQNDTVAPGDVTDLAVAGVTRDTVRLSWQPAGDDGNDGLAVGYEVRLSATPIETEADWNQASRPVLTMIVPRTRSLVTATILKLPFNSSGFVAIKAKDKVGNAGALSTSLPFSVQRVRIVATQRTDSLDGLTVVGDWGIEKVGDDDRAVFSDSPSGNYASSSTAALTLAPMTVTDASSAALTINMAGAFEADYDFGVIEVLPGDSSTWKVVDKVTGKFGWKVGVYDLGNLLDGAATFKLRFRITSDSSVEDDGWKISDIHVLGPDVD